jgi:hypothetical protein
VRKAYAMRLGQLKQRIRLRTAAMGRQKMPYPTGLPDPPNALVFAHDAVRRGRRVVGGPTRRLGGPKATGPTRWRHLLPRSGQPLSVADTALVGQMLSPSPIGIRKIVSAKLVTVRFPPIPIWWVVCRPANTSSTGLLRHGPLAEVLANRRA